MLSLLVGVLLEEGGEAVVSDIIPVKVASLGEVKCKVESRGEFE